MFGRSEPGPSLSAGDTIPIATTRRAIGSRARFSVGQAKSDCSSMSFGDIRFRRRLKLIRSVAGWELASIMQAERKEAPRHCFAPIADNRSIDDDPAGFLFSQIDLAHFEGPYEFFFESDA